jgi:hypothetical protein
MLRQTDAATATAAAVARDRTIREEKPHPITLTDFLE